MTTLTTKIGVALGLCTALEAGAAQADYIISANLQPDFTQADPSRGPTPDTLFQLIVTNAAVQQGSFNIRAGSDLDYSNGSPPARVLDVSGDVADFVSFKAGYGSLNNPEFDTTGVFPYPGSVVAQLVFDSSGDVTSGSLNFGDANGAVYATIADNQVTANVSNDDPVFYCVSPGPCVDSGALTVTQTSISSVPEPATYTVLGIGLLGLVSGIVRSKLHGPGRKPTIAA